jgi:hypothetical protein
MEDIVFKQGFEHVSKTELTSFAELQKSGDQLMETFIQKIGGGGKNTGKGKGKREDAGN